MQKRTFYITIAILILVISSLACGLFEGTDEPQENTSEPEAVTEETVTEEVQESEVEQEPPPASDVELGEEYRSEAGGYAFKQVPGYEMEEFFGLASMVAPDADPDLGPMLMLIGGTNEEETTKEEIFDSFMQDAESEDVQILDQREITVDGKPGILADIGGDVDGQQVVGRIVVVAVSATHQFTIFASAPQARWSEIQNTFDAVLSTVYFFEPQEIDLSDGNAEDSAGESQDTAPSPEEIPPFEDFPSDYADLPAGGFAYLLAASDGTLPEIVSQGTLQDQSTRAEYVLGLASDDLRSSVTLFIPLNVAPGVLVMTPYDENSATKGPGAAVLFNSALYTNSDGIIMIEEMQSDTISGTFAFVALDESGNELSITGFFNQLPLAVP